MSIFSVLLSELSRHAAHSLVLSFVLRHILNKYTLCRKLFILYVNLLFKLQHYLGDSPPWEQLVGEVKGLVLLLG